MKYICLLLLAFITANLYSQKDAEVAFRINEAGIIPEGIAYSETTDHFYVSSILKHKIIKINAKTGEHSDFIPPDFIKLCFVGMMVDRERNELWACANLRNGEGTNSGVYKFNVITGEIIDRYERFDNTSHTFNDLTIDKAGNVYFTDSNNQHIYKIDRKTNSLTTWFESEEIGNPNGITISDDNKYLYVATYQKGIRVIEIVSKKVVNAEHEFESKGNDGLKFYKNTLIGTQNYFDKLEEIHIVQYILDESLTKIIGTKTLVKDHPLFEIPTTHVIAKDQLFSLATSNLDNVNWAEYTILDPEKSKDVVVLRFKLNK